MQNMITKSVAVFSDERVTISGKVFVERLLQITGEDEVTVRQKFKSDWNGQLGTRIMFMSNDLPTLPDASGAIVGRMVLLYFPHSWLGREDRGLLAALKAELPAILCWSLDGLDRLISQGDFTEVTSSASLIDMLHETASPIKQFVGETCFLKVGGKVPKGILYDVWRDWCKDNGYEAGNQGNLSKKLVSAFGREVINPDARDGGRGEQVRVYAGIALRKPGEKSGGGGMQRTGWRPNLQVVGKDGSVGDE
jgi:phage/plasmid-associated DNA primase